MAPSSKAASKSGGMSSRDKGKGGKDSKGKGKVTSKDFLRVFNKGKPNALFTKLFKQIDQDQTAGGGGTLGCATRTAAEPPTSSTR